MSDEEQGLTHASTHDSVQPVELHEGFDLGSMASEGLGILCMLGINQSLKAARACLNSLVVNQEHQMDELVLQFMLEFVH